MKNILTLIFLLMPLMLLAQDKNEQVFMLRNEPFPYDSGTAISYNQYAYLLRRQAYNDITESIKVEPPKIIFQEKRRKGDGKLINWVPPSILAGVIVGFLIKK